MKVKESQVVRLYALQTERSKYLGNALDIMAEVEDFDDIDWKRVDAEYAEANILEKKIESVKKEIEEDYGIVASNFVTEMAKTVYPLSISRCLQCLRICGVEVLA